MEYNSKKALAAAGLRATQPRLAVMEVLHGQQTPQKAQDIVDALPKDAADTATVYRILNALTDAGIVRRIDLSETAKYFEINHGDDHHHVVCTKCGRIEEVHGCDIESLESSVAKTSGFSTISRHTLEFFGICNSCHNAS